MNKLIFLLTLLFFSCTKNMQDEMTMPIEFQPEEQFGSNDDDCGVTKDCGKTIHLAGYTSGGCEYTYRIGRSYNMLGLSWGNYIYYYTLSMKCDNGTNLTARWWKYGDMMRKDEVKEKIRTDHPDIAIEFIDELIPEEITE